MTKREPLMDAAYFENLVELRKNSAARFETVIQKPETTHEHKRNLLHTLFSQSYQVLIARYSQGESIQVLAEAFPGVVSALERCLSVDNAESINFQDLDDYVESLWLVSLAMIFDVGHEVFAKLLQAIGNEGRDMLFERLIGTRVPNRPKANVLIWPKPYEHLLAAADGGSKAPKLMEQFLKTWYSSLKKCYWYDNHKGPKGGGFFGYWSIEAAGVVKAFGIDDGAFREMRYYPKDLVHGFASALK
jgi:Domain of unknown function (DUF1911)/Domain of unknown function (DUF1910)